MQKTAVITGARGMDASNLIKFLLDKDYKVIGIDRRASSPSFWRHEELEIENKFIHETVDITDASSVYSLIDKYKPDECYNLAAMSFVAESFNSPVSTFEINTMGHLHILEAVRKFSPKTKVYFAGSSEMFGKVQEIPQTEKTPFYPRSPYGCSKVAGFDLTKNYREAYGLFACSGVLFNHEGSLRSEEFVTRKITSNIAKWYHGKLKTFELGNLDSKRDWGDSEDYIEGMWLMLQQNKADDYLLSTNETHTIREFIEECFNIMHINYEFKGKNLQEKLFIEGHTEPLVTISEKYFRPSEVDILIGDHTKASTILNWKPKTTFKELVRKMLEADIKREANEL